MLTNNTEILHLISRLGHGASYTLIEELDTKNAYQLIEKQDQADIISPNGVQKEVLFTMVVADNIDRREETLSGTNQVKMFFFSLLKQISFLLLKLFEWQSWIFVLEKVLENAKDISE